MAHSPWPAAVRNKGNPEYDLYAGRSVRIRHGSAATAQERGRKGAGCLGVAWRPYFRSGSVQAPASAR